MRVSVFQLFTFSLPILSLILAQCALGASAFSCTQISKTSFRYYSQNDRCGIRVSTEAGLYKENTNNDGLAPVYSSVASKNVPISVSSPLLEEHETMNSGLIADSSPVGRILSKISKTFAVATNVLGNSITTSRPPLILDEKDVTEEDAFTSSYHPPPLILEKETITREETLAEPQQSSCQPQIISLVDIKWLKAHERVVSEERVASLHDATIEWDAYKLPLLVDSRSGAILDGHHRYAVGRALGLSRLPAVLVDYLNDDSISVDVWPECGINCLTKEEVIEMSLSERVFPPKTSRHRFVSNFSPIHVPLSKLL